MANAKRKANSEISEETNDDGLAHRVRHMLAARSPKERTTRRDQLLVMIDFVEHKVRQWEAAKIGEITDQHVPDIRAELDTLQETLAETANGFLAVAERIESLGEEIGGAQGAVAAEAAMRMFELCSFQDLSGQRLSKVANSVDRIETHSRSVTEGLTAAGPLEEPKAEDPEAHLLNGPQTLGNGLSQADIDALLDSFD